MSYLLVNGTRPIEYRILPPDDMTDERGTWEQVEEDDPRIAQILSFGISAWGAFRMGLLDDTTVTGQSFQSAIARFISVNPIKTSTLMTEASKDAPYVAYLVDTWNDLVDAAEYVPGAGILDDWNGVAALHNVPLQWLPNGKLASQ
jgi:hypothetical protein